MQRIASTLALGLWASGIVAIFLSPAWLEPVRLAALALLLGASLIRANTLTMIVCGTALAASVLFSIYQGHLNPVFESARFALIFTIFLPALILIREVVDASPQMRIARQAFADLPAHQRQSGLVIGAQVLGVVVTLGALALTSPLMGKDASTAYRRQTAIYVLRGVGLCVLWSPFTVGIGYVLATKPQVPLLAVLGCGFMLASVGTLLSVFISGGWRAVADIGDSLQAFKSLYAPVGIAIVLVVLFASLTPFSSLQSVSLVMPVVCIARLLSVKTVPLITVLRSVWSTLGRTGNELLLFTSAILLGRLFEASGIAGGLIEALSIDQLPNFAIIALLVALGPVLSLLGMHSILIGAFVVALLGPIEHRFPDLLEAMIILFAWMGPTSLSFGSLSVGLATSLFRVDAISLIRSSNLAFMAVLSLCVLIVFTIWLSIANV